jgi:hypothetical protein
MKKFLAVFALAGLVGISACSAEEDNTEVLSTPEATTPPPVVDPTPIVVDSAPPMGADSMGAAMDTAAP